MTIERFIRWEPISGINCPCADISFTYRGPEDLLVTMHFSRTAGCLPKDLFIKFNGAIIARWESEDFGSLVQPLGAVDPKPVQLPRCRGDWADWSYPLLQVEHSTYLATYEARNPIATKGRVHFVLIGMNDLLHIVALPEVEATWVEI